VGFFYVCTLRQQQLWAGCGAGYDTFLYASFF